MLPYSNTNYGNIFSIWDRLFSTYAVRSGKDLIYGLDTHPHPHEYSHIGGILKVPFQTYRPPVGEKENKLFEVLYGLPLRFKVALLSWVRT